MISIDNYVHAIERDVKYRLEIMISIDRQRNIYLSGYCKVHLEISN